MSAFDVKNLTIAAYWEAFSKGLPSNMDATEHRERRRMFYAGAQAMLAAHMQITDLSDNAAMAVLDSLHNESKAFAAEVAAGRA
jgi:hypothetical protein